MREPPRHDGSGWIATLRGDLVFGLRLLIRQPTFTAVAVLSLALGIGFNTAIFSFLDVIFLHPLPAVRNADRVVALFTRDTEGAGLMPTSYPNFKDIREQNRVFSGLAAYQVIQVGVALGDEAEQVSGEMVSANYFELLGVKALLGRTFLPEEDRTPDSHPVVVLSHRFWTRHFGARRDVLGRTLRINNHDFTIVGVAPPDFTGTNVVLSPELWVPTMMYRQVFAFSDFFDQRGGRVLQILARLRPETDLRQARAEVGTIAARLAREYPKDNEKLSFAVVPLQEAVVPMDRRSVFVHAGALLVSVSVLLLLIACINISNLLLARTLARSGEIAVRLSLGAGRARLLQQLLTESFLLTVLAALAGSFLAVWTRELLWKFKPPYFAEDALAFHFDARVLAFTAAVALLTCLLVGTASALQGTRSELSSVLREKERSLGASRGRLSLRRLTIALQVALCLVCLSCAGFFLRSLQDARRIDPGFDTRRLLAVSFDLQAQGYDESRARELQDRLLQEARALPGVESASLAENRPLGGWSWWRKVPLEGAGHGPEDGVMAGSSLVGTDYFRTTGIPILRGRGFTEQDREGAHPVAIVNESLAKRVWPGRDPVGISVRLDDESDPVEIVGLAKDVKYRTLGEASQPFLYLALLQRGSRRCTLLVRSAHPEALVEQVRRKVKSLDPNLPIIEARSLTEVLERSLWAPRAGAMLLSVFGLVALVLAGIGVYGVTTYWVGQRRSEFGLRMALGARREEIVTLVLRQGMFPLIVGLAAGFVVSVALQRWIAHLLYSGGSDWVSLPLALAVLALVGVFANLVPAVRASRIHPSTAIQAT